MKVCQIADIEKLKVEGRTQTSKSLKAFLEENGIEFVDDPKEADLIDFHSSGILNSFKAAKFKKELCKKVIYSFYSVSKTEPLLHLWHHHLQSKLYKRKTKFLLSYSAILPLKFRGFKLKELDKVIVPSNFVKENLFKNTNLIRLGIDTERFKPREDIPNNNNNNNNNKIKVGFIGHPNVYKGVLDFAKASKNLSEEFETYIYASIMTDKIKKTLLKINSQLNIFGLMKDVLNAYHNLDIVVLPYRSYLSGVANPLVLLEAMACEKAIITTDFEHVKEVAQDGALIIKKRSSNEIVKAVKELKDSNKRKELGKRAREIVLGEFSKREMFKKYLELYRELENESKNTF